MSFVYAFILPIVVSIWFPITFVITYIIAVSRKDVPKIFPYISDTGNWSPESCIFGLMLNLGAILMFVVMYIRYGQIGEIINNNEKYKNLKIWNKFGVVLAIFACFGISVVGNFQETQAFEVHIIGAILAFGLGSTYQFVQTYISVKIYPDFGNKAINSVRICCTIVASLTFLITFIFAGLALLQFKGDDVTKWSKNDGGFKYHLISTISEWILALITMLFISLFTKEFKEIHITPPMIDVKA